MAFNSNSIAAANAVGVQNQQFKPGASVLPRKILVFGTYNPAITTVVDNVAIQVLSPEDAASKFGQGYMIHQLVQQAFIGGQGTPVYVCPQPEAAGAQAIGSISWTGSTGVLAGTLALYIAGERVAVSITAGMTVSQISDAVVAAINANADLPVTAAKRTITFETDLTSKSKGLYGNKIDVSFNWKLGDVFPVGVAHVVTAMTGGTGIPVLTTALNNLGTGASQNSGFYTDVVHGYLTDTTTLDAFSNYNGTGDLFSGNYDKLVARPFRVMTGDTTPGSGGLSALIAITNARLTDRTNGVVVVPGSPNHPSDIAALATGVMAYVNANIAEGHYIDRVLANVIPGAPADRWSDDYDNRNTAVLSGISPTIEDAGTVDLQNVCSFYRPASVPVNSNGYRSMRNISIVQNMLNAKKVNYAQEKWQGISIVGDVQKVSAVASKAKARDVNSVLDDEVALAESFAENAWIYESDFTVNQLKQTGSITIRPGALGFNVLSKYIFSGEGGIFDNQITFDISLAILGK